MDYKSVLNFISNFLENAHIPVTLYKEPFENIRIVDNGLRQSIYKDFNAKASLCQLINDCKEDTVYYLTDCYYCSYVFMKLPKQENLQFLVIGPFTYMEINNKNFLQLFGSSDIPSDMLPSLEKYYYNIAYINSETQFKNLINSLCDTIWDNKPYDVLDVHGTINNMPYAHEYADSFSSDDPLNNPMNISLIESRYKMENELMQAVSQGNLAYIDKIMAGDDTIRYVIPRNTNELRDYKNYLIIFNTLLRKAAEQGAVHPVYLDELSSKFNQKIEALTSVSPHRLEHEMLHKYCILVRSHSVKGYSLTIQKVINQIDLNLTSDLSLKALSEMFNISAGYLSTLFKRETGCTLTDYVNKKRIDYAIFLLNTTQLQIQTIATYCGISDVNYFTRIFKKHHGMTPIKYRELICKKQ
jgi:AraC-like DNA-binding protein